VGARRNTLALHHWLIRRFDVIFEASHRFEHGLTLSQLQPAPADSSSEEEEPRAANEAPLPCQPSETAAAAAVHPTDYKEAVKKPAQTEKENLARQAKGPMEATKASQQVNLSRAKSEKDKTKKDKTSEKQELAAAKRQAKEDREAEKRELAEVKRQAKEEMEAEKRELAEAKRHAKEEMEFMKLEAAEAKQRAKANAAKHQKPSLRR
jgi:hypothetical protein